MNVRTKAGHSPLYVAAQAGNLLGANNRSVLVFNRKLTKLHKMIQFQKGHKTRFLINSKTHLVLVCMHKSHFPLIHRTTILFLAGFFLVQLLLFAFHKHQFSPIHLKRFSLCRFT